MDELNNLQFFEDDELLSSINLDMPNFIVFDEEITSSTLGEIDPNCNKSLPNAEVATTTTTQTVETATSSSSSPLDQSRFPVFTDEDINELQSLAVNTNTSRSTKHWIKVVQTWCKSRNITENFETLEPSQLDKMLCRFYAEVKKKDGDDYEPESLKIMQAAIDRYLKEMNYSCSITRSREFHKSQKVLHAKALSLRHQGKGKRPNKSKALSTEEEEKLWSSGQLGDQNGRALTNANFMNLTEQMGLRGRQEHYDAYVEDFEMITSENGSEYIQFIENPTKTRSGGLHISRRTTPQVMWSTDGGARDPVRLFKLWMSKRPENMRNTGPLYLSIINRPKNDHIWYGKVRMGQNTIGNIMKSMASQGLTTTKRITNHSMRKTLVQKLKKSGQPRHIIKEITGHARESSLDDYDEVDEHQRRDLSHIISGFDARQPNSSSSPTNVSPSTVANTNQPRPPFIQPSYNCPGGMPMFQQPQMQMLVPMTCAGFGMNDRAANSNVKYSNCTINYVYSSQEKNPPAPKKRRYIIYDSDEEKEN